MDDKRFYVYCYVNPLKNNEPFYIGKGTDRRWEKHTHPSSLNDNSFKSRIMRKIVKAGYDLKDCRMKIMENLSESNAHFLEKKLIQNIGRRNIGNGPLANLTDGGDGPSGAIRPVAPEGLSQNTTLAQLTDEKVRLIFADLQDGKMSQMEIGRKYNVSRETIKYINLGTTYKHCTPSNWKPRKPLLSHPGSSNPRCIHGTDKILDIADLLMNSKLKYREISEKMCVPTYTIMSINSGKTWSSITKDMIKSYPIRDKDTRRAATS